MDRSDWPLHTGHPLQQVGVLLFILALLVGLGIPKFAVPRLGLLAHLLGILQGIFLILIGRLPAERRSADLMPQPGTPVLKESSNPQRAAEAPTGIVRLRAVVIRKDTAETAIAKNRPAEFSNICWCLHPARPLRIEISEFLERSILLFR